MTDHLPHDDEEFTGLTRQQIQDRMEPARADAYGDIVFGWNFSGITLEEGDKRLMAMLVKTFGSDHPAIDDMTALLFRARARPAVEPAAPVAEQEPVAWMDEFGNPFPLAAHSIDGKPLSWENAHKRKWKPLYAHPAEVLQDRDQLKAANKLIDRFGNAVTDMFEQLERGHWRDDHGHYVRWNSQMLALKPVVMDAITYRDEYYGAGETGGSDE